MSKFITPNAIPAEAWAALHALGLPKGCTAVTIRMKGDRPIEIDATYYATAPEGHEHALAELTKTYRLVEQAGAELPRAA